jgi:hypothetical protein
MVRNGSAAKDIIQFVQLIEGIYPIIKSVNPIINTGNEK